MFFIIMINMRMTVIIVFVMIMIHGDCVDCDLLDDRGDK